ncbi:MAG: hypothetical protein ISR48_04810 [Alphaproteobacteria bacterium]|nr:hypothetical protein [Alphaproteobacteria bacterium]
MKKTCLAFGAMVLAMGVSQANAESLIPAEDVPGEFSAGMALTTDYIFRGVSQNSDGTPAIQGSIDYSVDTPVEGVSFYAGAWGSNIEFGSDAGSIEIDYYGGFGGEVQGIGWDVGFVYFSYPGAPDASNLDYWEGNANLGYDFGMFAVSAGINASPDFTGETGDAFYYTAGVDVPLFKSLALGFNFGHQTVDQLEDYSDIKLGLSADVVGFGMELAYHDTFNRADSSLSDERAVFTISRSF